MFQTIDIYLRVPTHSNVNIDRIGEAMTYALHNSTYLFTIFSILFKRNDIYLHVLHDWLILNSWGQMYYWICMNFPEIFNTRTFMYFLIISYIFIVEQKKYHCFKNHYTLTCSSTKTKHFLQYSFNEAKIFFMNDYKNHIVSLIMQYCYTKHIDRVVKTIMSKIEWIFIFRRFIFTLKRLFYITV
jgi:hypothetical protein